MAEGVTQPLKLPRPRSDSQLLSSLVRSADDAIFAKGIDGTIMSWNAGAEQMYGYTAAEIIGSSVARLAPPDRADEVAALLARIAGGHRVDQLETVRVAKDGRRLDVSLTISPIRDGRRRLIGASTVARQINQTQRATLRSSAQRDLLAVVPAAVVGVDGAGNVRFWNSGAVELFGWAAEDVIGRPVHGDVKPLFRDEPVRAEVAVHRRDGSTADVLAAAFPVRDGTGVILEHVAIAIDISQHRRVSVALAERETSARASEARIRTLVELAAMPMATQRDGRIIYVNGVFATLFGSDDPNSFSGKAITDLLTPDSGQAFATLFADDPNAFGVADYEMTGVRPDGTQFPFLTRRSAIELPDGPATLATIRDLTAEKSAQAERDWLFAAVEQTAEMIVLTDLGGRIVYANGATLRATGYSRDDLIGAPVSSLGPVVEEARASAAAAAAALAGGSRWSGSTTYGGADGKTFEAVVSIMPVLDGNGIPVAMITIGRDITLERSLEAQLRQAQKMEAVGQLAGGIAHDFNNLLTAIRGYAELISRELPAADTRNRGDIDEILLNADRAALLTRQLLAFSRRQILRPQVMDAAGIVAGVAPLLRRLLGEDIDLRTPASPTPGFVLADPAQIEQVIVNLAVNARDAMPHGGELIIETDIVELDGEYARMHSRAVPGRYVLIATGDTGSGMDAETLSHVFEPFFTTKGPGEGTGLGLATVHGIVRQSGGSIEVYSEVGHGTSVKVYLPLVEGALGATAANLSDGPLPVGTERILLVEDNDSVRGFATRILKGLGYVVLEASRGDVALTVAFGEPAPIDMLLTDVVMPVLGGRELAEQLIAQRPLMRVLFMSGYPAHRLGQTGKPARAFGFLPKPFTARALAYAVREVLDQAGDHEQPA